MMRGRSPTVPPEGRIPFLATGARALGRDARLRRGGERPPGRVHAPAVARGDSPPADGRLHAPSVDNGRRRPQPAVRRAQLDGRVGARLLRVPVGDFAAEGRRHRVGRARRGHSRAGAVAREYVPGARPLRGGCAVRRLSGGYAAGGRDEDAAVHAHVPRKVRRAVAA